MNIPEPKPLAEDVLSIPEIADLAGLKRGTVDRWKLRTSGGAPLMIDPDDYVGDVPVWRLERIVAWIHASGRRHSIQDGGELVTIRSTDIARWRKKRAAGKYRGKTRKAVA